MLGYFLSLMLFYKLTISRLCGIFVLVERISVLTSNLPAGSVVGGAASHHSMTLSAKSRKRRTQIFGILLSRTIIYQPQMRKARVKRRRIESIVIGQLVTMQAVTRHICKPQSDVSCHYQKSASFIPSSGHASIFDFNRNLV